MKITSFGITDIGRMRRRNEDAFVDDGEHQLYAVADGLGGLSAGDRASQTAIATLQGKMREMEDPEECPDLRAIFQVAHKLVCEIGYEADPGRGSGTTLTAAVIRKDRVHIGHIGDSAAYLFNSDNWKKLTIDHTEAEAFRQEKPGQPVPSIFEHTLTRCLGQPGAVEIDLLTHPLRPGSRLLLCTDGVTRAVDVKEIHDRILAASEPKKLVHEIIDLANERGGADNSTAVAVFAE